MGQRRLTAAVMILLLGSVPALATDVEVKKKETAAKPAAAQKSAAVKKDEKKAPSCDPIVNTLEDILAYQGKVGTLLENKQPEAVPAAPAATEAVVWRETDDPATDKSPKKD